MLSIVATILALASLASRSVNSYSLPPQGTMEKEEKKTSCEKYECYKQKLDCEGNENFSDFFFIQQHL